MTSSQRQLPRLPARETAWAIALCLTGALRAGGDEMIQPPLARQLAADVAVSWSNLTFGESVERLSAATGVPAWLDRRVDRGARVDFTARSTSVRTAWEQLAGAQGLAVVPFRTLVYVGPAAAAEDLPTLSLQARDALSSASNPERAAWLRAAPATIPRLAEPRTVMAELARETGAPVTGLERIPHDLWAAQSLPSLAPIDRALLVLIGFDLTLRMSPDGRQCEITPIAHPVEIVRRYAPPRARRAAFGEALREAPASKRTQHGTAFDVTGSWALHERLAAALAGARPAASSRRPAGDSTPAVRTLTLRVKNQPVDRVLAALARQTGLTVAWESPPPAGAAPLASCDVQNATLDEVLAALLDPLGLTAQRNGSEITVRAAR